MIGGAWLAAVVGGFGALHRFDTVPGSAGTSSVEVDRPTSGHWKLVVFVHPHCPCSQATLDETAEIAKAAPDLFVRVVFVRPKEAPAGWERTELWAVAERIPGAEVVCDVGGGEALLFGAETSGQAVLIDPSGRQVFHGGLTESRGQRGASLGHRAVLDWMNGRQGLSGPPVFGCPLQTPAD